jgi:hypothetical protein
MTKKLVVPMLALGLALFGCGSSSSGTGGSGGATGGSGGSTGGSGGSTGGSGGSTGGSGGSTGGSGGATGGSGGATGGSGGSTGGSGGSTGGAGGSTDGGSTGGTTGDGGTAAVDWTMCPASGSLAGVSAQDFCAQYMTACMFDAAGGTAGMERFKTMGDCVSGYMGASATKQGCMAYHLCVASKPEMKTAHCPHPPEAVLATPAGPCK